MKVSTLLTMTLIGMSIPTLAMGEGKYKGSDFKANGLGSREIKDETIQAEKVSEEALSLESAKLNFGDNMSYIRIPLTHMEAGTAVSPIYSNVFVDGNVTFKARCFVTNTTLLQTIDIYPESFTDGATQRGEDSAATLTSATGITSKQLFNVAASATASPKFDSERTPIFFVSKDGTVYNLALSALVNMPNQSGKCSFTGFIFKIAPEA